MNDILLMFIKQWQGKNDFIFSKFIICMYNHFPDVDQLAKDEIKAQTKYETFVATDEWQEVKEGKLFYDCLIKKFI